MILGLLEKEHGQGLVEYSLIIGLISLVLVLALSGTGGNISGMFFSISTKLSGSNSSITAGGS